MISVEASTERHRGKVAANRVDFSVDTGVMTGSISSKWRLQPAADVGIVGLLPVMDQ